MAGCHGPRCPRVCHRRCGARLPRPSYEFRREHRLRIYSDFVAEFLAAAHATALGDIRHSRTRPYRPATNGKVERFNRTLLAEWAYARPWSSDGQRTRTLTAWLHSYNHHRHHTAISGPLIGRVSNLAG